MSRWFHVVFLALSPAVTIIGSHPALAGEVLPENPQFTRHVVPMLSRLGCNAGACHGMVKGQGGFRLSLFGVGPALDHERIAREWAGRRVNLSAPESSLLLLKAGGLISHGGGKRFEPGGAQYEMLRRWIAQGAALDDVEQSTAVRLLVSPASVTTRQGDSYSLNVEAVYPDGSTEDVTALCSYEMQDTEVAQVDQAGNVQTKQVGDTALVIRFPGQVATSTLIVVPEKPGQKFRDVKPHNFVDEHILDRLRLLDIAPAELCDDVTFLRRASLDTTGALPSPEEIRAFVADKNPDKRAKKIDELLKRPGHAALWATKFMDVFRITSYHFRTETANRHRGYEWLRARLSEGIAYDDLVERILLATSREGRSYEEWAQEELKILQEQQAKQMPETYAARRTLDLFWLRRSTTDVDPAIRVGHSVLGLRLQCAQCHRHPFDVWTQDDLLSFANFFMRVPHGGTQGGTRGGKPPAEVLAAGEKVAQALPEKERKAFVKEFGKDELYVLPSELEDSPFADGDDGFATVTSPLGTQTSGSLRLLGQKNPIAAPTDDSDRRKLVMQWLREPDNPFFARAIVNRVWAHYFGRGIVDPPDDLSPLNPPSHPELLDALAAGFVENNYDLAWLHRTLLLSRTYQQSSVPHESGRHERRNFASFYIRRLPAEVLLDAMDHATGIEPQYSEGDNRYQVPHGPRLVEGAAVLNTESGGTSFALGTFGMPKRDVEVICDCEREDQATMLQALYLANHPDVRGKVADPAGRLFKILKDISDDQARITEIFLATLCRQPSEVELRITQQFLADAKSPEQGYQGLMWSLINSNDFLFNQ